MLSALGQVLAPLGKIYPLPPRIISPQLHFFSLPGLTSLTPPLCLCLHTRLATLSSSHLHVSQRLCLCPSGPLISSHSLTTRAESQLLLELINLTVFFTDWLVVSHIHLKKYGEKTKLNFHKHFLSLQLKDIDFSVMENIPENHI